MGAHLNYICFEVGMNGRMIVFSHGSIVCPAKEQMVELLSNRLLDRHTISISEFSEQSITSGPTERKLLKFQVCVCVVCVL